MTTQEVCTLPEFVPTIKDLQDVFLILPPAEKVKDSILYIPVEALGQNNPCGDGFYLQLRQRAIIAKITFIKIRENDKMIWVYEGKVKHE